MTSYWPAPENEYPPNARALFKIWICVMRACAAGAAAGRCQKACNAKV
jgi:hypothetical protein